MKKKVFRTFALRGLEWWCTQNTVNTRSNAQCWSIFPEYWAGVLPCFCPISGIYAIQHNATIIYETWHPSEDRKLVRRSFLVSVQACCKMSLSQNLEKNTFIDPNIPQVSSSWSSISQVVHQTKGAPPSSRFTMKPVGFQKNGAPSRPHALSAPAMLRAWLREKCHRMFNGLVWKKNTCSTTQT